MVRSFKRGCQRCVTPPRADEVTRSGYRRAVGLRCLSGLAPDPAAPTEVTTAVGHCARAGQPRPPPNPPPSNPPPNPPPERKCAGPGPEALTVPLPASWSGWIEASKRGLPQSTQIRSCMSAMGVGCQRCRPMAHLMLLLVFMQSGCASGPVLSVRWVTQGENARIPESVPVRSPGVRRRRVSKRAEDPARRPDHRSRRRPPCGRRPAPAAAPLRCPRTSSQSVPDGPAGFRTSRDASECKARATRRVPDSGSLVAGCGGRVDASNRRDTVSSASMRCGTGDSVLRCRSDASRGSPVRM